MADDVRVSSKALEVIHTPSVVPARVSSIALEAIISLKKERIPADPTTTVLVNWMGSVPAWLVNEGITELPPGPWTAKAKFDAPPTGSSYVFVRNLTRGTNYYEKNADTQTTAHQAASTTKLMTALVVLQHKADSLEETVTITSADIVDGSVMGLKVGDIVNLSDLLYGLLLPSGNDAGRALARHVGDAIFAKTGTGKSGVDRFVEEMNAYAASLGMTKTVYGSPHGVNPGGDNLTSARDLARMAAEAFSHPLIREIAGTKTHTATITGPNARAMNLAHTDPIVRQSSNDNIGDVGVLACKTGSYSGDYSAVSLWEAYNGDLLLVSMIAAKATGDRWLDFRSIIYQACIDVPALAGEPSTDSDWSDVILLMGADGEIVDESSVGATPTVSGATVVSGGIGEGALSTIGGHVSFADDDLYSMGDGDFTVEFFFRGTGSEPTNHVVFVSKYDSGASKREWTAQYEYNADQFVVFVSPDGSATSAAYFKLSGFNYRPATVFNGALRHLMVQRSGDELSVWLDGVKDTANTATVTGALLNGPAKLMIGARQHNTNSIQYPFSGLIDELRITKGTARGASTTKFSPVAMKYFREEAVPTEPEVDM